MLESSMSVKVVRETTFANLMQKLTLIDYKRWVFPPFYIWKCSRDYLKVHTSECISKCLFKSK